LKSLIIKILSTIISFNCNLSLNLFAQSDSSDRAGIEVLPILSYDTDTKLGYGVKTFFYDQFKTEESFDVLLFNSSGGEQWYKFVFSAPDFESRQGTEFPFALDIMVEYDKWKNYDLYYFDLGPTSDKQTSVEYEDKCIYEFIDSRILVNHAFGKNLTGFIGLKFISLSTYNYERDIRISSSEEIKNPFNEIPSIKYLSTNLNCKWDTRNSYINPSNGYVLEMELEYAPDVFSNRNSFFRQAFITRYFQEIFFRNLIFAGRVMEQILIPESGSSPFLTIPVGGNNTLRGVPVDKFRLTKVFLSNIELRYCFWWRFGLIGGVDIGYGANKDLYPKNTIDWIINPVIGLRLYMDNFIVRADAGFYKNEIGFYLNFGHIY
jgi:hypothetical protein